jgi:hypothetical protein
MALAGSGASIGQARADTAPQPEVVEPQTQTGGSNPTDGSTPHTNKGQGGHKKHPGHKKWHRHHWEDELRKRLEAHEKKLRKRIEDLQSRGARALDGMRGIRGGDVNAPARTTPKPTNTSDVPGFDDNAATDAPADPSSP